MELCAHLSPADTLQTAGPTSITEVSPPGGSSTSSLSPHFYSQSSLHCTPRPPPPQALTPTPRGQPLFCVPRPIQHLGWSPPNTPALISPPPPRSQRQSPSKPPCAGAQSEMLPRVQDTVPLHEKVKRSPAAFPRLPPSFALATGDTLSMSHRTLLTSQAYIRPWARPHSRMVHRRTVHGHQLRGIAIPPLYLISTAWLAPLLPELVFQ